MMDCRKALVESNGDFEAAIDFLRKKGQKVAALRGDREAKEGVIIAQTAPDNKTGYIINLSCETDFVSKNEDFIKFAEAIMDAIISNKANSVEELKKLEIGGETIADKLNEQIAKIGENIGVTRFEKLQAPYIASYIHGANRIGVLVGLSEENEEAGKNIAMQIAAMNPIAIDEDAVAPEIIEREKNVAIEQVRAEGKPAELAERIAKGKLNKFFKENTLLAQAYVKNNDQSVSDYIRSVNPGLKITGFARVALG